MKNAIKRLRHDLHRHPELSGDEEATAQRLLDFFATQSPDKTVFGLGGHGLAFVYEGGEAGPTVMLRADLDALPIHENEGSPHRSENEGVAHLCGHDGHMTILAEVGRRLAAQRPAKGRAMLLFQPAEETGAGAAAVLADPAFEELRPDICFALHNLPGHPLGSVVVRDGVFASASRGMTVIFKGRTAHAAQPETGRSPALAMARFIERMNALPDGIAPAGETAFATVVGSKLGEKAFGTAPGRAEVWVTLRSETDRTMDELVGFAAEAATREAVRAGLHVEVTFDDVFTATVNAPEATATVRRAGGDTVVELDAPLRWSEDFGRFTAQFPGALFGLGAGEGVSPLHDPAYDFPDELIDTGADIFMAILHEILD